MDYDHTKMPEVYDAARGYSQTTQSLWRTTIVNSVKGREINRILDLGCGTGRYSASLRAWFDADVVGIEPSEAMLVKARDKGVVGVTFKQGSAEAIPLEDNAVDMIFMSMVFHHIGDKDLACSECHRVLKPGGVICLRAGTKEQVSNYPYAPFFDEAENVFRRRFQSVSEITSVMSKHGMKLLKHTLITSEVAADWHEFARKISLRADSTLNSISDDVFERGLSKLKNYASQAPKEPVTEPIDYFVVERI